MGSRIVSRRQPAPATAVEMAGRQREISVAEFFLKNRHLLGFDTPAKALVTAVKEAVDNALDACEEAGILPDIKVQVGDRYGKSRVLVEDNGPGSVRVALRNKRRQLFLTELQISVALVSRSTAHFVARTVEKG